MKITSSFKKIFGALLCGFVLLNCSSCNNTPDVTQKGNNASNKIVPDTNVSSNDVSSYDLPAIADINSLDSKCIGWGPGNVKDHMRSVYAASNNEKYKERNALFIGDDNKNVYLTFDEGYENGYTAPILDTLKQKKVKAVFFVTADYVKKNPELVKRMINEGHTVGNHSWSHPSLPGKSNDEAKDEIMKLHNYVKEEFGYEMKLFRFPMGEFSERTLEICKQCGYKSVFWSFAYKDWLTDAQPDEAMAFEKITSSSHNGAIFLLHAVSKTNSNILGRVIDDICDQGYCFSELKI